MRVTMLLCDFAQVAEGKLNIIGAGWSQTNAQTSVSAVAIKVDVPWDLTNKKSHSN
jgi:hypothetical protein